MNLTLHLIANDFRYLRLYLSLWSGLVILQAVLIGAFPQHAPGEWRGIMSLSSLSWPLAILKVCLLTVIVSQLVQKDSTVGSTAFWLSRPIAAKRLLGSKLIFLLVAVVLPVLVVEILLLSVRGVIPEDILRSIPQIVFLQILPVAVAMMLASVTSNLPRLIFLGVIALVALPLLWFILSYLFTAVSGTVTVENDDVPLTMPIPPPSYSSFLIGILLVLVGTSGAVVAHQYLTRRTMLSRALFFSGVLVALLSMGFWSRHIWETESGSDSGILDPTQVTTRIEGKSLVFAPVTESLPVFDLAGEKKMLLRGDIALDDFPPGVVVLPAQVSANLVLPSGESLARHVSHGSYAFMATFPFGPDRRLTREKAESLGQTLGDVEFLDGGQMWGDGPPELFAISDDLYERYKGVRTVYSAEVDYLVQKDEITTMRLEKGYRFERGSDRVEILSVDESYRGGLTVLISESTHKLMGDGRKDVVYLLINTSRGQALLDLWYSTDSDSMSSPPLLSFIFPMLAVRRLKLQFDPPRDGPPIDPGWVQGSEMSRV
ncbi:MAG: hypothetical protein F4Z21_06125 [Acidobacteria bacterium]|nr:hypothetical protein [Acidobacteriota bacterium]